MTTYPPGIRGDIKLDGNDYRLSPGSWQLSDVSDYAPQGDTPGTSAMFGDLQLYQPLTQETFVGGLGFVWGTDPSGYLKCEGDIDCRFPGSIFLSPKVTIIDQDGTHDYPRSMVPFYDTNGLGDYNKTFYGGLGGNGGLKYIRYTSGVPTDNQQVAAMQGTGPILYVWTNGKYLFVNIGTSQSSPYYFRSGLMYRSATPCLAEGNIAYFETALAGSNNDIRYTCREAGTQGNSIRVRYVAGGTAGSEVVTVAGNDISISIADGVSTATQVLAAVKASSAAMYLVNAWLKIGDTGAGTVTAFSYTNLANGTDPRVWQKCGVNGFARNFGPTVLHSGYAYCIEEGTNYVHYDSDAEMDGLEGDGPLDTKVIVVGPGGAIPVIQLITYGTALYAARYDGLYSIGEDHIARKVLDFSNEYSTENFASMAVWNSLLIFTIRHKIYTWNGSKLNDITPGSNADLSPSGGGGGGFVGGGGPFMPFSGGGTLLIDGSPASFAELTKFRGLIGVGEWLYATAHDSGTLTTAYLLAWNGGGWHQLNTLASAPTGFYYVSQHYDAVQHFLFQVENGDSISAGRVYYRPGNPNGELPRVGYFAPMGIHRVTLPAMTMGRKMVKKSSPSVLITTRGTTVPTKAYLQTALLGGNNDLYFEARYAGLSGNSIRIRYTGGGTAGSEVVNVVGNDIEVVMENGVSTANQILTALLASSPAMALISARLAALNNGTGTCTTFAYNNLANGTDTRSVMVEYSLDGGAYVILDTVTEDGTVELSFAGPGYGKEPPSVEYNFMSLRLTLQTDEANHTPVVEDVTIRYLMRPGTVYGWTMDIIGATYARFGDHLIDKTAKEIKEALKACRDSAPPLKYVDIDGEEYWVHLTSLNGRLVEVFEKGGTETVGLEYLFRVSLIETGLQSG